MKKVLGAKWLVMMVLMVMVMMMLKIKNENGSRCQVVCDDGVDGDCDDGDADVENENG